MMTREQAEALLLWAEEKNPGPWGNHSRAAGRAAETIARAAGDPALDPDRAYVSGLLHDIGRYEGVTHLRHVYAGYALLMDKGEPELARVCLTHSFGLFFGFANGDNRSLVGDSYFFNLQRDYTPHMVYGYLQESEKFRETVS